MMRSSRLHPALEVIIYALAFTLGARVGEMVNILTN